MSSFNAQLNRAFQHFDVRSGTLREFTQCFLMARFIRNCIPGSQKLFPFFHQDFHVNLLRCRHRGVKRCLDNCLDKLVQNSSHKTRTRWLRKSPTGNYGCAVHHTKIASKLLAEVRKFSVIQDAKNFFETLNALIEIEMLTGVYVNTVSLRRSCLWLS